VGSVKREGLLVVLLSDVPCLAGNGLRARADAAQPWHKHGFRRSVAGSAIGTAAVDIEPVVQVVHSVGSIRFGRLPRREPTTVLVALRDAVVRSVPELGSGCRYRSGRGQVERHPHALRDPRGVGDRFCAGAEDRIPATSSSGPPGLGWIGGPLGPRERGLRHPQGPLSEGTVRLTHPRRTAWPPPSRRGGQL